MRNTALGALALLPLLLAGCTPDAAAKAPAPPPPAVDVAHPVVREITEWDEYTGRLAAREAVEVRARVGGFVDSIHFADGQLVAKGDLLFVIDPRPFQAALAGADAEVKRLETRLALAKNELERGARLVRSNAISAEEHDTRAKAVDEAVAALEGARAARERARLEVEFTEVRAPMAGRTSRHLVSVGNLVSGGSSASTLLTTIVTLDPIHAYFDVDEQAFLRYARLAMTGERASSRDGATPVQLALADDGEFRFDGHVDFVENELDPRSGTLRGRALVDNEDERLLPGVFVRLRLPASGQRRAVLVPDAAVGTDQTERFVYVVDAQGVVAVRKVTLGRLFEGLRVIEAGLEGDETIVVRGVQRVRPGAAVTPNAVAVAAVGSAAGGSK
jgi:RND family efflux transporter MFP subunit